MQGQLTKATQEWASLFTNLPVKKWWRAAPGWISILLVILVAKSASDLTWLIFAPAEVVSVVSKQMNSSATNQAQNQPRLRTVAGLHLFGEAKRKPIKKDAPIDAPKTGLKLTLRGVFAASSPEQAMALIADARGDEKVYKKSETIFSGVTLYEIYPDKVILERSGNFETLNLPRDEASFSARKTARSSNRSTRPRQATRSTAGSGTVRTRTVRAGKRLDKLKQQITENPTEFWKNVRIEPVTDSNKQIKGYTFNHNDRQMMRALGLRPGDVITEVNGQQVTDPSVLSGLMGELGSASSLSLGIERNGRRENININM